jgi:hypothetical protein
MIAVFDDVYLRDPNVSDIAKLLSINETKAFSRMIGSIDCMHWERKNGPFAWQVQYSMHAEGCTIIFEVVASNDLRVWHSFFSMAGSHNDINGFQWSQVFSRLVKGNAPVVIWDQWTCRRSIIYHDWSTLVKMIHAPKKDNKKSFAINRSFARKTWS